MWRDTIARRYRRFLRDDPRRDVDEELAFHLAMREDEYRRAGMNADAAHAATLERFGNFRSVHEECLDMTVRRYMRSRRSWRLQALRQDAHFAIRTLRTNLGYSLAVTATMAIGIGANAAVFSVANGVLLRPLPFAEPQRLVRLWSRKASRGLDYFSVSPADFKDWRAQTRAFAALGAYERQREAILQRAGTPELVSTAAVTPEVFTLLGTHALVGRTLLPSDTLAPGVVVLSYGLWTNRFGADSSVVGRALDVDGRQYAVVGVMPPRFTVPGTPAVLWTPLSLASAPTEHSNRYLRVLGRLAPGVGLEQGRRDLDLIAARLAREHPLDNGGWSVNIMSVPDVIVGTTFRNAVLLLTAVVGMVLLVACANAANLQLARSVARSRELALRAALGASRARLTLQLLTESLVLALVAGSLGLGLAVGGVRLLTTYGASMIPRLEEVRLDAAVVAFTGLVALASAVVFGLWPALRASGASVSETLKEGGRGTTARRNGMRGSLVVAEVTLSLMLLVAAGLVARSFLRLQAVNVGFDPSGLSVIPLRLSQSSYPGIEGTGAFFARVLEATRAIPGVRSAAAVSTAPFAGANSGTVYLPVEQTLPPGQQGPDADYRVITPGYFHAMGIRMLRGRDFSVDDRSAENDVIVISRTMAERTWRGQDPIGRRIRIGDLVKGPEATVVGIVEDARYQTLESPNVSSMMYFNAVAHPQRSMALVVRQSPNASVAAALRSVVSSVDSRLPAPTVTAMEEVLRDTMSTRRFALILFGIFAGCALALALVGLYGVLSYLVRLRVVEMGVRLALGASRRTLLMSVLGPAMRLVAMGLALGLIGTKLLVGSMRSLLFGVETTDPLTYASIAALLAITAVMASLLPALRATRIDPVVALRQGG